MSKLIWLIEDLGEDISPLVEAAKKQGHNVEVIKHSFEIYKGELQHRLVDKPVIAHCSINACLLLRSIILGHPTLFFDSIGYKCHEYYPFLIDHLLNANAILLPYGALLKRKEWIYKHLGIDGCVFIRPNSELKTFTGFLCKQEEFASKCERLSKFNQVGPKDLLLLAEPRNITDEFRFIVVDNNVIGMSRYGHGKYKEYGDKEAIELANKVSKLYNPDRAWTLDICKTTSGSYYVLEIGAFSCAGLYNCNRADVVREVSRVAMEEYEKHKKETGLSQKLQNDSLRSMSYQI